MSAMHDLNADGVPMNVIILLSQRPLSAAQVMKSQRITDPRPLVSIVSAGLGCGGSGSRALTASGTRVGLGPRPGVPAEPSAQGHTHPIPAAARKNAQRLKCSGSRRRTRADPRSSRDAAALPESGGKGTRTPDLIHAMDALYQN